VLVGGAVPAVLQFALGIAGRGGWHAFFAHSAFRALAWVTGAFLLLSVFSGAGLSTGDKEGCGYRWLVPWFY
jgi:hypothetical protein